MAAKVVYYKGKPWGHENCMCGNIEELRVVCANDGLVASYFLADAEWAEKIAVWHDGVCKYKTESYSFPKTEWEMEVMAKIRSGDNG